MSLKLFNINKASYGQCNLMPQLCHTSTLSSSDVYLPLRISHLNNLGVCKTHLCAWNVVIIQLHLNVSIILHRCEIINSILFEYDFTLIWNVERSVSIVIVYLKLGLLEATSQAIIMTMKRSNARRLSIKDVKEC